MDKDALEVGALVRFNSPHGSVGKVEAMLSGGFGRRYHVRWYYGYDVSGERMTAVSNWLRRSELVRIVQADFDAVAERRSPWAPCGGPS